MVYGDLNNLQSHSFETALRRGLLQIDDAIVRGAQQTTFGCETVAFNEKIRHTTERFNLRVGGAISNGKPLNFSHV